MGQVIDPNFFKVPRPSQDSYCIDCEYGSYQEDPEPLDNTQCILCEKGFSTGKMASTKAADCKGIVISINPRLMTS